MPLPHYNFELVDSWTSSEESCRNLPDQGRAMDAAHIIAKRVRNERPEMRNRGFLILVTDESGDEVCRVPIDFVH